MTPEELQILQETSYRLRLADIPRWTIVDMRRRQNVAEHSFNVLILSISLYEFMENGTSHNKFDRESLMLWAIDHDMDEIETGDMPSTFKRALEELYPGAMNRVINDLMATKLPSFGARKRGVVGSYPYDLVKIADKLEELLYNRRHGYDKKAQEAMADGMFLLRDRLLQAEQNHPRYDWKRTRIWLEYFLLEIMLDFPARMPTIPEVLGLPNY
jgi:5'-deoxynucleotidase YfbR-like HD superfamily hydrolase